MKSPALSPRREVIALSVFLALFIFEPAYAQVPDYARDRQRAIELINESKFSEALPLFETLAAQNPTDAQVVYGLGLSLWVQSKQLKDDAARRQVRLRAREALTRAQELGVRDQSLENVLASILPDGSERGVSPNKKANEALQEGYAAFREGQFDRAAKRYEQAYRLDPKFYEAALYTGDSFYRLKEWDKAAEWFARAIEIDPDRETAYRYWGDALMLQGKNDEARAKFFDALIAEPYNQLAWKGLIQWAGRNNVKISQPLIRPPNSVRQEADGRVTLGVDPGTLNRQDGSNYWLMYDLTRAAWLKGEFARNFPGEKIYRRSLREEATALRMVAEAAAKDVREGKMKALEPSLAALVKLNNEGLLEPYILLARADYGIRRDYPAYRAANREKLRRYLSEYVAGGQ